MKTAYNFNAGPCVLPKEAIESTIAAIRDFDNTGIGLLEISHRTPRLGAHHGRNPPAVARAAEHPR